MRIPPFGLREGITNCSADEDDDGAWIMTYRVLNPGWFTWPVEDYVANVYFTKAASGSAEQAGQEAGTNPAATTIVEWHSQWTPLPPAGPVVSFLVRVMLNCLIDYVAEVDSEIEENVAAAPTAQAPDL
jgi:hypothetical protein